MGSPYSLTPCSECSVITQRLPQWNYSTVTHNAQHTTSLASLRGSRLVVATETEAGSRWAEAKLKSITGGEPITARFLYQRDFTFVPQFKLMLSGNHRPSLHNVDEAMRRFDRAMAMACSLSPAVMTKFAPTSRISLSTF